MGAETGAVDPTRILVVTAVAGSGKTRRVVGRLIDIIVRGGTATVAVHANSVRREITERILKWASGEEHQVEHNGRVLRWHVAESCWVEVATVSNSRCGGGSHDYISIVGLPGIVHVASIDGLVHMALSRMGGVTSEGQIIFGDETVDGTDYIGKRTLMHQILKREPGNAKLAVDAIFPPLEGAHRRIGLFIDEFQDTDDEMVQVTKALALEVARRGAGNLAMVVGDPRQNVFGEAEQSILDFCEQVASEVDQGWFKLDTMSVCHRCPQGHLALINHLYPPKLGHQRMMHPKEESQTQEEGEQARSSSRPVLIGIDTWHHREAAEAMAKELVCRFEAILFNDRDKPVEERIRLEDVAVLSPKINGNPILSCLEDELNRRLRRYAPPGQAAVKLFRTGEASGCIKWEDAKGRVAMLSVHADKGMTHRLCLFCDATEGVIPRKAGSEVQYTSQLYVGLTRSSETLLVGVGVGDQEMGCSTLFPKSSVSERVISRYFRNCFSKPEDMLAICDWSPHSVCLIGEVVWFPIERYAEVRPDDKKREQKGQLTTVRDWAMETSPEQLVNGTPCVPLRFAENLTHHSGMLSVRRASFEIAIGKLAEQRFQSAFRSRAGAAITCVSKSGLKCDGWREAAQAWRLKGSASVAGAIEWACQFCGESTEPLSMSLDTRARQLWCLALVDLAEIHDDAFSDHRPTALTAAANLYEGGTGAGIDEAAMELAIKIDINACRAVEWLKGSLEAEMGTGVLSPALFEKDCCVVHPKPISGRMDLHLAGAGAVVELKATTTQETGENVAPEPEGLPMLPRLAMAMAMAETGDTGDDTMLQRAAHLRLGIVPERHCERAAAQPPAKRARRTVEIPDEQPGRGAMSQAILYAGMINDAPPVPVTRSTVIDISRGACWEWRFTAGARSQILERGIIG